MQNQKPEFKGTVSQISKQVIQRGSIISNMKGRKKAFAYQQMRNPTKVIEPESESEEDENDDVKKQIFMNQKLEGTEIIDKFYSRCAEDLANIESGTEKIDELVINIDKHLDHQSPEKEEDFDGINLDETPQKDPVLENGVFISEYTAFLNEILNMRITSDTLKVEESKVAVITNNNEGNKENDKSNKDKQRDLFVQIFNKACVMMQA